MTAPRAIPDDDFWGAPKPGLVARVNAPLLVV
jgi:hypothetical protein